MKNEAGIQHDGALLELIHNGGIVGHHDDGGAVGFIDLFQQPHDFPAHFRVQVARGLVRDEQGGIVDDGSGDGDPLLLAAGELVRITVGLVLEIHQIQDFSHSFLDLFSGGAHHFHGKGDIFPDGHLGQQAVVLEHAADEAAVGRHLSVLEMTHVNAVHDDFSAGGNNLRVEQLDHGGLARTGSANEIDEFTGVDGQIHVVDGVYAVRIGFHHIFQLNQLVLLSSS